MAATDIKIEDLSPDDELPPPTDRLLSKQSPEEILNRMRKKYGLRERERKTTCEAAAVMLEGSPG